MSGDVQASSHLVEMVADFWGAHWAECSCGWRSVRSIDRRDVERDVKDHRDPFARLIVTAAAVTEAAMAERKRGDE